MDAEQRAALAQRALDVFADEYTQAAKRKQIQVQREAQELRKTLRERQRAVDERFEPALDAARQEIAQAAVRQLLGPRYNRNLQLDLENADAALRELAAQEMRERIKLEEDIDALEQTPRQIESMVAKVRHASGQRKKVGSGPMRRQHMSGGRLTSLVEPFSSKLQRDFSSPAAFQAALTHELSNPRSYGRRAAALWQPGVGYANIAQNLSQRAERDKGQTMRRLRTDPTQVAKEQLLSSDSALWDAVDPNADMRLGLNMKTARKLKSVVDTAMEGNGKLMQRMYHSVGKSGKERMAKEANKTLAEEREMRFKPITFAKRQLDTAQHMVGGRSLQKRAHLLRKAKEDPKNKVADSLLKPYTDKVKHDFSSPEAFGKAVAHELIDPNSYSRTAAGFVNPYIYAANVSQDLATRAVQDKGQGIKKAFTHPETLKDQFTDPNSALRYGATAFLPTAKLRTAATLVNTAQSLSGAGCY